MKIRSMKFLLLTVVLLALLVSAVTPFHKTFAQTYPKLYWGSYGDYVFVVQDKLKDWGYYDGPLDGYYGNSTFNAVKEFQRRNGLIVDGIVGEQTYRALGVQVPSPTPKTEQVVADYSPTRGVSTSDEMRLLARLIGGEARAEPYVGKVAVGAVILNRIESPKFPNTMSGVIYQPLAFESVSNGEIWRGPLSDELLRAARDALNGWDPTYGSLFFWNPTKRVNPWIWSRNIVNRIGGHVFAQ